ncbi:MAG: hypothetical protein O8C64_10795 [Candidatus Methanoperedens sp.]|nr:hypothetical protein [Candidatus Methanoperedens sp.]MCZ7405880.1 hypothetical protein [Candidatus Methanoperedens sp.]
MRFAGLFRKKQTPPSGITFDELPEWLESKRQELQQSISVIDSRMKIS